MNRIVRRLVIALLFGVAVYGAIVLWRGVGTIEERFGAFRWSMLALACGLAFSNYLLRFLKWEYYLAVLGIKGVPKLESLLVFLSGFVLTVTPGKVGEVFKSLILFQLRKVPIARTAPIVVAERLTDLIGVIVMIAVGSTAFPGGAIWASAGAALVIGILVFVTWVRLANAVLEWMRRGPGFLGKIEPKIAEALKQLRNLTTPARLIWPTLLSIAAWSLEGIALWVILRGFDEPAPLPLTAFFYATATLAGALVPVPGGLGVTDKLLEEQMARLGHVAPATATAAMLLVRLATLWFAVLVGFIALGILRAKFAELMREDAAHEPKADSPDAT